MLTKSFLLGKLIPNFYSLFLSFLLQDSSRHITNIFLPFRRKYDNEDVNFFFFVERRYFSLCRGEKKWNGKKGKEKKRKKRNRKGKNAKKETKNIERI